MSDALDHRPDVLVLGGGGILGEVWMAALLAGIDEAGTFDPRECRGFVGTSAGSIVATTLAAGVRPADRLGHLPEQPAAGGDGSRGWSALQRAGEVAAQLGSAAAAPLTALALGATSAPGAALRRAALARIPDGRRSLTQLGRTIDGLGVDWDGRLRVTAVEVESGRRVVLGAPGAPPLSVADAVKASCAIPGVFAPVRAGGRTYLDGGVWSPTNMDAADAGRGDHVLCLNPTGSLLPAFGRPAGAIGPVSRSVAAAEALSLKRRGAHVTTINPDRATLAAIGANLMDPGPRERVVAAGLDQGRALAAGRPVRA